MLKPPALFGLLIEVVVLLLGLLLAQLGLTGRFVWSLRREGWILLAAVLLALGVRSLLRAGRYVSRWLHYTRGGSFVIVGVLMFVILVAPFAHMPWLLTAAGVVLALRGLIGAVLVLRTP
jgi:hypothetical protein